MSDFPNTDFSLDAKFKLSLIENTLASKENYIANYYLSQKKWIPAIKRFKYIVENYDETDYVEEALHRLVEANYIIGLEEEAKKYASILGYNYNSSKWFEQSYKVLNKDYKFIKKKQPNKKKSIFNRIVDKIK